jgi:hypothetical protein
MDIFKIIAVDFDGTLCENRWPGIGEPNEELIQYLKDQQKLGARVILWTCRADKALDDALLWCYHHSLCVDAVNENLPEMIDEFGFDTRKIFAHEYIDDRMCTKFNLPYERRKDNE